MPEYEVIVWWEMAKKVRIKAGSPEEANEKAERIPAEGGDYVEESFCVLGEWTTERQPEEINGAG